MVARARRAIRVATVAVALLAASACGAPELTDLLERYRERVEQSSGSVVVLEDAGPPRLPRPRERVLPTADLRMGALDFLALQGCGLGSLAGFRNSPLGRVMVPTRRLVYELSVLDVGHVCAAELEPPRRERIEALLAAKRDELPVHLWNAVWGDSELARYLAAGRAPGLDAADGDDLASLASLRRRLEEPLDGAATGEAIETALAPLRDEEPLGATLHALDAAGRVFDAVRRVLDQVDEVGCGTQRAKLTRAFQQTYLPLQPPLAPLDRRAADALPELDRIFRASAERLDTTPASMRHYHEVVLDPDAPGGLWQRYRAATLAHAAAWGPTLRACGMLPGEGSGEG